MFLFDVIIKYRDRRVNYNRFISTKFFHALDCFSFTFDIQSIKIYLLKKNKWIVDKIVF